MLPDNLDTNQVRNRLGAEVEFVYQDGAGGQFRVYKRKNGAPNLIETITVQHRTVGKGTERVRQSNISIVKEVVSDTDPTKRAIIRQSKSFWVPEGHLADLDDVKDVDAYMNTFCAQTSAGTSGVLVMDGTGLGAEALINGTI